MVWVKEVDYKCRERHPFYFNGTDKSRGNWNHQKYGLKEKDLENVTGGADTSLGGSHSDRASTRVMRQEKPQMRKRVFRISDFSKRS